MDDEAEQRHPVARSAGGARNARRRLRASALPTAGLLVVTALAGTGAWGQEETDPVGAAKALGSPIDISDPEHVARGSKLYQSNCTWYCHGKEGARGRSPRLRGRPELTVRKLYLTIANGRKRGGKVMPAWKTRLSPEQMWQLVAYIVSLREAK